MPLTPLQRDVLAALAPHRGASSWVAGSVVLADWLSRVPTDIDIHHSTGVAMRKAMAADRATLAAMGLTAGIPRLGEDEMEICFAGDRGTISVNWVREPAAPEDGVMPDTLFGARATHATVIRRKVDMYLESQDPKHAKDLCELVTCGVVTGLHDDLRLRRAGLDLPRPPAGSDV